MKNCFTKDDVIEFTIWYYSNHKNKIETRKNFLEKFEKWVTTNRNESYHWLKIRERFWNETGVDINIKTDDNEKNYKNLWLYIKWLEKKISEDNI